MAMDSYAIMELSEVAFPMWSMLRSNNDNLQTVQVEAGSNMSQ
jgi:hypothetical protein